MSTRTLDEIDRGALSAPLGPARTLDQIDRVASPAPLDDENFGQLYIDVDASRGRSVTRRLAASFSAGWKANRALRVLFSGHRGCGKSTELQRLKRLLQSQFTFNRPDLEETLGLHATDAPQIVFYCALSLVRIASHEGVSLPPQVVAQGNAWLDPDTRSSLAAHAIREDRLLGEGFDQIARDLRVGDVRASQHIRSNLTALLSLVKALSSALEAALAPRRVLLLVDDLDKLTDGTQARQIFCEDRLILQSIPCSVLFTFPIALWYETTSEIKTDFDEALVLPMVAINSPPDGGDPSRAAQRAGLGRLSLYQVLNARVDLSAGVLAPGVPEMLIDRSGGVLRDLLLLLRTAVVEAMADERDAVQIDHVQRAYGELRDQHYRRMIDIDRVGEVSRTEILDALAGDWPRREVVSTAALRHLLQHLCVLEYDGEPWFDLHPAVRDLLARRAHRGT